MDSHYKGRGPVSANYAKGGAVFTTRSRFLKTPNPADTGKRHDDGEKKGKGGTLSKMEGETKKLPTVKPHT